MYTAEQQKFEYKRWMQLANIDQDIVAELTAIRGDADAIQDRFYHNLEFGTGGLRGVIGAGTNRMNVYTVGKATQGYCNHLNASGRNNTVCIAYDSRNKSELFAETAAGIFAANGIKVYFYPELMPTPSLSFAVRYLHADGGIAITASHNPAKYNGYKIYSGDGCQITLEEANRILTQIYNLDIFTDVKRMSFQEGIDYGKIERIDSRVVDAYISQVSEQGLRLAGIKKDVSIVYTPLNGAGLKCVTMALERNGFTNIFVVPEQSEPNGGFPTCPYPNPEMKEALSLGLAHAERLGSDLLLATDPDCDRVGIAVRQGETYQLLSGNEVGVLLFDYICKSRIQLQRMPTAPVAVKTIVTTDMATKIAEKYGVELRDVLTGFKFIGEQIGLLEKDGEDIRYIFGFEESYGYLSGSYVRDKDAVNASLLICEMLAYYKGLEMSLVDALQELYREHGYFANSLQSFAFEGADGFSAMQRVMRDLGNTPPATVAGKPLIAQSDYLNSVTQDAKGNRQRIPLPSSDVLKFAYMDDLSAIVRPSGTEPKLKIYYSAKADNLQEARALIEQMQTYFTGFIGQYQ